MTIRIDNELIIPFGRTDCDSHRMIEAGGSTTESLTESRDPQIYINRVRRAPVTLDRFSEVFSSPGVDPSDASMDPFQAADLMCDVLRGTCEAENSYQHLFLSLYFDRVKMTMESEAHCGRPPMAIRSLLRRHLMPLPQTHLYYLTDFSVLAGELKRECVRVDFVFWTGHRLTAVLLNCPGANQHWAREEELLKLWGVEILRLNTDEVESWAAALVLSRLCEVPESSGLATRFSGLN
jgi:hypothetical protein